MRSSRLQGLCSETQVDGLFYSALFSFFFSIHSSWIYAKPTPFFSILSRSISQGKPRAFWPADIVPRCAQLRPDITSL